MLNRPARRRRPIALISGLILLAQVLTGAPGRAAGTGPFPPQVPSVEEMNRLRRDLDSALGKVRQARLALDRVVADFEAASDRLGEIQGQILVIKQRLAALDEELSAAQASVDQRASAAYRLGRVGLIDAILSAKRITDFLNGFRYLKSVAAADVRALGRVRELKGEATRVRSDLEERHNQQEAVIRDLARQQKQVERSLVSLDKEVKKVQVEIDRRKAGFAFPVRGSYSYVNSWGAPRMEGTVYYHTHQGTDIFALRGTSVVAVVDGVIERAENNTLGGIKLWVRSPGDGWTYYYAHLSGYAPGIANGARVRKGEAVGYVGNTGNAKGGPTHLHFETHVPSGQATNPYPILRRVDPLVP